MGSGEVRMKSNRHVTTILLKDAMKILQSHGTKVTKVEADEALAKVKSLVKEADALASSAPFLNQFVIHLMHCSIQSKTRLR